MPTIIEHEKLIAEVNESFKFFVEMIMQICFIEPLM